MVRKVAVIVLYDKDKRILLQHRDEGIYNLPGYWSTFGGEIEEGENPEEAVKREIVEELNYHLKNPRLVIEQEFEDEYYSGTKFVFVEEYRQGEKLILHEGQEMRWVSFDEAMKLKLIPHDMEIIEKIKKII